MDNSTLLCTAGQRVDYIDALKGFLILSVVMCHVAGYCIGIQDEHSSFHPILFEFRNPPFFFISGMFAYKIDAVWNGSYCYNNIKRKFISIAWPTILFLAALLYVHPSYNGHTFLHDNLKLLLGMDYWGFFFFFILGVLARKHYDRFVKLISNNLFLAICIFVFFIFNLFFQPLNNNHFNLFRIITYITGIILVFTFFKTYPPKGVLNRIMTFIGERTLDIYLIHYFFLPLALYENTSISRDTPMPIIEFTITFSISLTIIAISLLVSYIIRLSPISAYIILGRKIKKTK